MKIHSVPIADFELNKVDLIDFIYDCTDFFDELENYYDDFLSKLPIDLVDDFCSLMPNYTLSVLVFLMRQDWVKLDIK